MGILTGLRKAGNLIIASFSDGERFTIGEASIYEYADGDTIPMTEDGTVANICNITIGPGTWLLSANFNCSGSTAGQSNIRCAIDTNNASTWPASSIPNINTGTFNSVRQGGSGSVDVGSSHSQQITPYIFINTTTTTLYLKGAITSATTNYTGRGYLTAVRFNTDTV